MKTSSAKQKGRLLQQFARDTILSKMPPWIGKDDVRSTGMGQQGVDVQLSTNAQKLFPFAIECKSRAKQAIYADYEQAEEHAEGTNLQPLVILKQNNKKPLVVMDATWFITYFLGANCENSNNSRHTGET